MPVKVEWKFEKPVATDRVLKQLENDLKVTLPFSYQQLVKQHNGARPRPNVIKTSNGNDRVVKTFLTVHPTKGGVKDVSEWLVNQLPKDMIPFANDPFGNYFCFNYETSRKEPTIVFWSHEKQQVESLANCFEEFLNNFI
ncbi:hypothetical protein BKP45_08045 [Anaerobacillus alkalidiazotrophicus]|uniref:Knr4/Smi1-like domain-containing protein n=1 Tax=Anaerobacillus alkalidiazotrophicus TaxID=472963 RepID=A0A1S2M7V0_9BACI|nr:SMI1/KNR4 family protein [Anaerobacillus alkalidiazotrophicus]OIJ20741.1 hypothetical protein BKP45_08045 [Anaerobacillus alkalidiazotrophicus]